MNYHWFLWWCILSSLMRAVSVGRTFRLLHLSANNCHGDSVPKQRPSFPASSHCLDWRVHSTVLPATRHRHSYDLLLP
ncbi:hypothetical protein H4582DRAFT_1990639 [Lactarius indigo]|nr:hypothetical protein H4582DRAFT_2050847 [Lactarius indigo]KAI9428302.1 hypothetical protein H4582DRAFT_2050930 [Lactarius indigo]KAI9428449.1 hypothetical protein H4582DRAFT_2046333 [Lactarius indigo]KAI9428454.1 hypothetical protein H4582DRAFT_2046416 [Lactarius indigo]KAI9428530.1 hypothetical protein H4582DRAFT_2044170 [Lactarius indigo]